MPEYYPAPQVAELAQGIIESHHDHLASAPIVYVFRSNAQISGGRITMAKARLFTGLNAFLPALASGNLERHPHFGYDFFCMEVAGDQWYDLTDSQQVALVDHELCHFDIWENEDGDKGLWIRGHDVEEFLAVARRHGAWVPEMKTMVDLCAVTT